MTNVAGFMGNGGASGYIKDSSLVFDLDASLSQSYAGSGTSWNDLSSTGLVGTNGSPMTFTNTGYFTFNNTFGCYSAFPTSSALTFGGVAPFTLEVWFRPSSAGIGTLYGRIVGHEIATPRDGYSLFFNYPSTGNVSINCERWAGGSYVAGTYIIVSPTLIVDKWQSVLITYDGSNFVFWWNNVNSYTGVFATSIGTTATTTVVGAANAGFSRFTGDIAIVRMYNRALTNAEIGQNFNADRGRFGL